MVRRLPHRGSGFSLVALGPTGVEHGVPQLGDDVLGGPRATVTNTDATRQGHEGGVEAHLGIVHCAATDGGQRSQALLYS